MKDCCNHDTNDSICYRKKDKKTFSLPRKFTKDQCKTWRGFTMKSSCAPYQGCHKKSKKKKSQNGGSRVQSRSLPRLRNISIKHKKHKYKLKDSAKKRRLAIDEGIRYESKHTYKDEVSPKQKAASSKKKRFNILRIYRKNNNPQECNILTNDMKYIDKKYGVGTTNSICKSSKRTKRTKRSKRTKRNKRSKRTKRTKSSKQFLYNPDDPSKSFDVYIDKDPSDTIPIKYTTIDDVKRTIRKLERLYKQNKYPHKRIWQVGMIMYVRLKVLKDKKPREFKLSERYFKHLGKRTKIKNESDRKKYTFRL